MRLLAQMKSSGLAWLLSTRIETEVSVCVCARVHECVGVCLLSLDMRL